MGVVTTLTTVSGVFLNAASRAAQRVATSDAGEPSTPTTMPRGLTGADISFSLHQERRYIKPSSGANVIKIKLAESSVVRLSHLTIQTEDLQWNRLGTLETRTVGYQLVNAG